MKSFCTALVFLLTLFIAGCQNNAGETANNKSTPAPSVAATTPAVSPTASSASSASAEKTDTASNGMKTTPSGLQYQDLVIGDGPKPQFGQTLRIHYTGKLPSGAKFDSSEGKGPLDYKLGDPLMIKGWNIGIGGDGGKTIEAMRVGGRRKLIIPPSLGYGAQSVGVIPANSILHFEVELVGIKKGNPTRMTGQ